MAVYVDIEKSFGKFQLKVKFQTENETLSLLGASGCGKTMTLKCIAGIEKPDRGKIIIDDKVVFDSEKRINLSPQQRHVGLLFQNYALFPDMTVLQNIHAGARREKDKNKREQLIQDVICSFGLTELVNHYPRQLSGGQQQRVALARILVSSPDILLLDEPFSALDHHLRFRMEQEVRRVIREFGKTVILVSHDRDEVYRMADKIAIMNKGSIEAFGDKKNVFSKPQTKEAALLTGCKNISHIKVIDERHIFASDWGLELTTSESFETAKYVGIRMQDVSIDGVDNQIHCQVIEEIENPFSYIIMLKPCEMKYDKLIGWEIDKKTWIQLKSREITICLNPDSLIQLN